MNVGSLFSGCGGLDLGLHYAGHRHVFFCEWDAYRRDVLRARWPGVPVYDDVRAVAVGEPAGRAAVDGGGASVDGGGREAGAGLPGGADVCAITGGGTERGGADAEPGRRGARQVATAELRTVRGGEPDVAGWTPAVDLLCGGFPCQDLSVAGKRAGLGGDRSGLFFEFARIIDTLRPGWLLIENVPGLLSSNGGRDFGVVLGTLADLGYGVAWRVLDSRFFGVPQRRRRVFIVGAVAHDDPRAAAERAGEILAVGQSCGRHLAKGRKTGQDVAGALGGGSGERGWAQDTERMTFLPVAHSLMSHGGNDKHDPSMQTYVAAPLTKGSATGEGVNPPGRRQEDDVDIVTFTSRGREDGAQTEAQTDGVHPALRSGRGGGRRDSGVAGQEIGVRRLTPTECERLQGFPDGWTQLGDTADSKRYSALGDAVTVNVSHWIGSRLASMTPHKEMEF